MKILVYGAGVLGSYLAHELYRGNHSVTMLARGKRYDDLKKHGLVIEHIRQKVKTIDHLQVTDSLNPNDVYDIIFVAMQKSQLDKVFPVLAKNTASKKIVLIGNNCEADKTYTDFIQMSDSKPMLLNGFLSCGGHRDGEIIYNWHGDKCNILIGAAKKTDDFENVMSEVFSTTKLQLKIKSDMNSWLKYHCALIAPICLAIQIEGGASKKLRTSEALRLSINAIKESINMFDQMKFIKDPPHDMKLLKWSTTVLQWIFARLLPTKTGHLIAVDHALAAVDEIKMLTQELLNCSTEYKYPLPSLTKLYDLLKEKTGNDKNF